MTLFVIEDEAHAEWAGEFRSFGEALEELKRRSGIAWNQEPNRAPCQGWAACGRDYAIIELDDRFSPWREVRRTNLLKVSANGVAWNGSGLMG